MQIQADPETKDSPTMGSVDWKIVSVPRRMALGLMPHQGKALNDGKGDHKQAIYNDCGKEDADEDNEEFYEETEE